MTLYALNATHPQDIAGGRMLAPGETVDLDKDAVKDPDNQRLIQEGLLIKQADPATADAQESSK